MTGDLKTKLYDKLNFESKDYIAEIKKRRAENPNIKMYIWGTLITNLQAI